MISGKFVHLIEEHGDDIITRVLSELRHDEQSAQFRNLLEAELRESGRDLLRNLGEWLSPAGREELGKRYERLGRILWEHRIPLHEAMRGIFLIREKTEEYVEDHVLSKTNVEFYAEEELERALTRLSDMIIIHMARGYELAVSVSGKAMGHSLPG